MNENGLELDGINEGIALEGYTEGTALGEDTKSRKIDRILSFREFLALIGSIRLDADAKPFDKKM